ncbi:hypothetical protein ACH4TV_47865 [Streptomyces sp. NPDC020898]|uniref:hypothetical protein n=1 Tax=Streptomyces sp. NPDC020898 TaxID=3365101 RepID=UPI0037AE47E4
MGISSIVSAERHNRLMCNKRDFRMADGAEIVSQQGDEFQLGISIPLDEDGEVVQTIVGAGQRPLWNANSPTTSPDQAASTNTGRPDLLQEPRR